MRQNQLDSFNLLFPEFINQILSSRQDRENTSILKPKDSGPTKIDINISLSNNNIQKSISDSYSKELPPALIEDLEYLIATFVKDVAGVYGQE
jgi:hypothetical protein